MSLENSVDSADEIEPQPSYRPEDNTTFSFLYQANMQINDTILTPNTCKRLSTISTYER
jgi:hypothetical protein